MQRTTMTDRHAAPRPLDERTLAVPAILRQPAGGGDRQRFLQREALAVSRHHADAVDGLHACGEHDRALDADRIAEAAAAQARFTKARSHGNGGC